MDDLRTIGKKVLVTLKDEGIVQVAKKSVSYMRTEKARSRFNDRVYKDVLFINGVDYNALPHPPRYRVQHQIEQLRANGIECDEQFWTEVTPNIVKNYRLFVIFRCPYNDRIGEFICKAKELNKTVIYDIDDLVIDIKYTNQIKYLDTMSKEERAGYDQGVRDMQHVMNMCDAVITTTERLADELRNYKSNVFINRNVASETMLELSEKAYREAGLKKKSDKFKIGYFSGSITHNDDFILIRPAISRLMEKYNETELHIVGILDIPKELEPFKDRIVAHEFMDWMKLPELIAEMDVNLAPLENTIFNEAKSENKWVEAALVRVPTVASNLGAFAKMIENEKTGMLCDTEDDWYQSLERMILDREYGTKLAKRAYEFCRKHCVTLYTGMPLTNYIKSMYTPNIAFILPGLNISGGIMVAFEHAIALKKAGYDVSIVNMDSDNTEWKEFQGVMFPVVPEKTHQITGSFDKAVATMWFTVRFFENHPNILRRYYLVQNYETDFYEPGDPFRIEANALYSPKNDVEFITISKWCKEWLKDDFGRHAGYVRNGIHVNDYWPVQRDFSGKIRILIEGDCGVYYKNVDESFQIANRLDKNKYEICYLSYNAEPKEWYQVDEFFHKVPFEKVSEIYRSCHILLKTSFLESFSYPPLEMMATGGFVVAVPNDGNKEYLVHEDNCLLYELGDINTALEQIERITNDEKLRETLYAGGQRTAHDRDWDNVGQDILKLYGCKKLNA